MNKYQAVKQTYESGFVNYAIEVAREPDFGWTLLTHRPTLELAIEAIQQLRSSVIIKREVIDA